jgi:exosome complex RNA-binding protein Csl4
VIASCPDCGADLIDEGFSFWCPACQQSVTFAKAIAVSGGADD